MRSSNRSWAGPSATLVGKSYPIIQSALSPQDFPVPFSRGGTITSFTFGRAKPDFRREEDPLFSSIHINHFYGVWLGPRNECIVYLATEQTRFSARARCEAPVLA